MKKEANASLCEALRDISQGSFLIECPQYPQTAAEEFPPFARQSQIRTDGKGCLIIYSVCPGITVSLHYYLGERFVFHHQAFPTILEINYCRLGRTGWNMKNGTAVYLGAGDLAIHSMDCCSDSVMMLPLGYYEGISVSADLTVLQQNCPDILREANFDAAALAARLCMDHKPFALPASSQIEAVFGPLCGLPEKLRLPYYKLKVQELLLYLSQLNLSDEKELTLYFSRQTEQIRQIHDLMILHPERRYTIDELSRQFLINTSTLKEVFKAVYGLPIATYMKEYRIHQAMKLLRDTDDSIASIASRMGYESQGKFSRAFRDVAQLLPSEYRRLSRS